MDDNNSWKKYKFAFVDLEGSGGQDKENEEILEIAIIKVENGCIKGDIFHSLINPQREIRNYPWLKHGLTNKQLKDAPVLSDIETTVQEWLRGTYVVAHNARVDWKLLKKKCQVKDVLGVLDTLKLSRNIFADLKHHKLIDIVNLLDLQKEIQNFTNDKEHRATYDCIATALIFLDIVKNYYSEFVSIERIIKDCSIDDSEDIEQICLF
ncbi:3'-5' exonuclease [Paenibacillus elgii]|uniref:3'-5' exonuclease n=1 Tax=Paenibacillus elgii TaxID=189691 RepID=UPI0013D0E240|nr:3'-5' exonuclease [Paenibacillus elgii]